MKAAFEKGIYRAARKTKVNDSLPDSSQSAGDILSLLCKWSEYEKALWNGSKKYESGGVYHGSTDLIDLQNRVIALFSRSNPLHPSTFPFVRKMLSEIVAMTITYFNGNPYQQKGLLTSGGTESILMAVRAYKYYAKSKWNKNIPFNPELILPVTAHAAFHKAAEMYEIKTVTIAVNNKTYKPNPNDIENAINSNTIGIIGSAPDYAHGIMDDIDILSEIAYKYNIPFHVDCCLGSYLISTIAKTEKYKDKIRPFDFRNRGVSSISCDTHKFGYAVKGTSVLMFRTNELRRCGYFCLPQSTIGLYSTPTLLGSKNGAVIAACWATLMYFGKEGYKQESIRIMNATEYIKHAIRNTPQINSVIEIMGDPVISIICWKVKDDMKRKYKNIHVYQFSDAMKRKGWSLDNCINPPCTHLCVTGANCNAYKKFVVDFIDAIKDVMDNVNTNKYTKTGAAMYGAIVESGTGDDMDEFMKTYLDVINDIPSKL